MPRKTAQQRRVEQLIAQQDRKIAQAFREAIAKAGNAIDRAALIRFLEAGDIERAVQLFRIDRGLIFPLEEAVRQAYIAGGVSIAADLPRSIVGQFGFNGSHPRATAWAQGRGAELVTAISEESVQAARRVIVDAMQENRSLSGVARDLAGRRVGQRRVGGIIGLTDQQADRMINIRSMLRDPQRINEYFIGDRPRYLESDRRFDRTIRRAIQEGRALTAQETDRIAEAYKAKATGNRGRVVAQHEARLAQSAGRDEGYLQLMESEAVETVTCRWQHTATPTQRDDHAAIDGTIITVGETFAMPDGSRMAHPHDPAGGARNSIGCKCIGIYRVELPKG